MRLSRREGGSTHLGGTARLPSFAQSSGALNLLPTPANPMTGTLDRVPIAILPNRNCPIENRSITPDIKR